MAFLSDRVYRTFNAIAAILGIAAVTYYGTTYRPRAASPACIESAEVMAIDTPVHHVCSGDAKIDVTIYQIDNNATFATGETATTSQGYLVVTCTCGVPVRAVAPVGDPRGAMWRGRVVE